MLLIEKHDELNICVTGFISLCSEEHEITALGHSAHSEHIPNITSPNSERQMYQMCSTEMRAVTGEHAGPGGAEMLNIRSTES